MIVGRRSFLLIAFAVLIVMPPAVAEDLAARPETSHLHGVLIDASEASPARLKKLVASGTNTVVFPLNSSSEQAKVAIRVASASAEQAGLALAYWIEVARSPELADQHPEWMASLQTHDEWRRFFPEAPEPKPHEVAKTYPWVPILAEAPFEAQRQRVLALLAELPSPELIFLNDLQGAPSACGCGNTLCRWTSDYGERRTTVALGDDAAARFIAIIQQSSPQSEIIPVWTTECEEHDGSPDGACAGVGCFHGICWKAYTRQLMPVAKACQRLGVLALYKQFQRDDPRYGAAEASWVDFSIQTFKTMPPRNQGTAIPASRIIAVLQGWDLSSEQIEAQRTAAIQAGANGYVIAIDKIEQSWSPKILPWK